MSHIQPVFHATADRVTTCRPSWSHSPQLVSSLMSLQSGLLSHRYSIRIHVPSPHLCSSGMQGLMLGVTKRDAEGKKEGGVRCWRIKYMQAKPTVRPTHYNTPITRASVTLRHVGKTTTRFLSGVNPGLKLQQNLTDRQTDRHIDYAKQMKLVRQNLDTV